MSQQPTSAEPVLNVAHLSAALAAALGDPGASAAAQPASEAPSGQPVSDSTQETDKQPASSTEKAAVAEKTTEGQKGDADETKEKDKVEELRKRISSMYR